MRLPKIGIYRISAQGDLVPSDCAVGKLKSKAGIILSVQRPEMSVDYQGDARMCQRMVTKTYNRITEISLALVKKGSAHL